MAITVACDVCRHRIQVKEHRLGDEQKCMICSSVFELEEAPETDETETPDGPSNFKVMLHRIGDGLTGIAILCVLGLMLSLVGSEPRSAVVAGMPTRNNSPSVISNNPARYAPPVLPSSNSIQPGFQGTRQQFVEPMPTNTNQLQPSPSAPSIGTPQTKPQVITPPANVDTEFNANGVPRRRPQLKSKASTQPMRSFTPPTIPSSRFNSSSNRQPISYNGPNSVPPSQRPVTSPNQLKAGQIVIAFDGRGWYAADVLRISGNQVRVHYRGWGDSWDTDLPLSSIQLLPEGVTP